MISGKGAGGSPDGASGWEEEIEDGLDQPEEKWISDME